MHVLGRIQNERTVIVNRGTDGFGFTLADASPVIVTGTTENGSAARAGITAEDEIIKVCTYYIPCTNPLHQVTSVNYCILTDLINA